jgi:hypothetical protein
MNPTVRASLAGVFLIIGCAQQPAPKPPREAVSVPTDDWRSRMIGKWQVRFYVDSAKGVDREAPNRLGGASGDSAIGILQLYDTLPSGGGIELLSELDLDFTPVLGRPISCVPRRRATVGLAGSIDSFDLDFTPGVADCGFVAQVFRPTNQRDSLIGTWYEDSFAGPVVLGRFRMTRQP